MDLCCTSPTASYNISDLRRPDLRSRERFVCTLILLSIRDANISISAYKQLVPILVLLLFKRRRLLSRTVPTLKEVFSSSTYCTKPDVLVPYSTYILCLVILVCFTI
jgi:hypothetical protein